MDPLIKKEIRLLLPAWVAAMLLAILPPVCVLVAWIVESPQGGYSVPQSFFFLQESIVPIVFALGVLLLGISSFGQELNFGSFGALLSQPAERRQIWSVKVVTLAIAFITVWLTAIIINLGIFVIWTWVPYDPSLHGRLTDVRSFKSQAFGNLTLSALVTFSGGLWTTLLLRQTTGAFWFTLLTPLAIIMGMSIVLQDWMQAWNINSGQFVVVALVLYSIAGFLWARRMFLLAQDVQWTGGEVSLPWREKISDAKIIPISLRPRHWLAALTLKEIQLHEASLAIAAVLLVLHLGCVVIRKIRPHFVGPDLQFILETFWILWLLMPLLIGATAIAEERRIGILDSQLCGPVSRRAQFFVKFFTALILSLLLGGAMPWLIEGRYVLNGGWLFTSAAASGTFITTAGIFLIAFYASSLAHTTLQAMGYAMLFAVVIFLYEGTNWIGVILRHVPNGLGVLKTYLSIPILLLVLIGLASWNFKWLHQNRRLWQRNIIALIVAGVFIPVLASAIYFRPWELVLPLEPRGPIRINNPARLHFVANFDAVYALLPDGRLWADTFTYMPAFNANRPEFIGGSDWVDLAVGYTQAVGIRSDGILWNIQRRGKSWFRTTQIGSDRDWLQAANDFQGFLLLKRDGTLWALGFNQNNGRVRANSKVRKPGAASSPLVSTNVVAKNPIKSPPQLPVRISDDADWTSLYSTHLVAYARKNDGVNWTWRGFMGTSHVSILGQETNVDNQWSEVEFGGSGLSHVEIKADGELWFYEGIGKNAGKFQLGRGMTWKTATFGSTTWDIMAIRSDGTLWEFPIGPAFNPGRESPWQVGHRSDWVALVSGYSPASGLPLASDGSIWDWTPRSSHAWLAPSRRPFCVGNIFGVNGGGK